jgi:hypothetical protein
MAPRPNAMPGNAVKDFWRDAIGRVELPPHPARRLADLSPKYGGEVLLVSSECF